MMYFDENMQITSKLILKKKKWKYSLLCRAKLNHTLLRLFLGGPIQSCVLQHHLPSKSHNITEILLKGALNTINPNLHPRWLPILKIEMSLLCLAPLWWGDILFLSCSSQFVSTTPLKLLNRISWNLVGSKDTICSCAYYQEMMIAWILWELCPFELRNFPKFTTEAACQHNSSETTEQNFMKLGR